MNAREQFLRDFIEPFKDSVPEEIFQRAIAPTAPGEIIAAPGLLNPYYERWIGADQP